MNLCEIFSGAGLCVTLPDCEVTCVTENIDNVTKGSIFVAVSGEHRDGNVYIEKALEKGAVCIVSEKDSDRREVVRVSDARLALSLLCSSFYNHSHKKLKIIGVTGTNGKTTVCEYISYLLRLSGRRCAVLGTLGARSDGHTADTGYTTPTAEILYKELDSFVNDGCEYCIMEVSSQALAQKRVDPIRFGLAVFTNIGTDHLDWHKTAESYLAAKARLVFMSDAVLINADDVNLMTAGECFTGKKYTFSVKGRYADFSAKDVRYNEKGISYIFFDNKNIIPINIDTSGEYSVYNSLCAFSACEILGLSCELFPEAAKTLPEIKGRMQRISAGGKDVFIDFAHTPQALEAVLQALRSRGGKIITVFGCGGDRDKSKRPLMGEVASRLSDAVILTDDNPRSEPSSEIIDDILSGIGSKRKVTVEPDRRKAIEKAIKKAKIGDTVLVAGKGHEDFQITGSVKQYFSDELTVRELCGLV